MNGDWRLRLLRVQGIWMLAFWLCMTAIYVSRPSYAPTLAYESAHLRWQNLMAMAAVCFLLASWAITAWFSSRRRRQSPNP
ncbi:MAG: hypothetical protein JSS66_08360 [Armatimonadetes bacterium]|nr:hypothetical protein [Armatimonadota bacterium]